MTAPARPRVVTTIAELRSLLTGPVALVPTMGALHDGHLALVERARQLAPTVVVSIFVNPLQFGAHEDLDRYPRTPDADLDLLAPLGVEYVFMPAVEELYPEWPIGTTVTAGPVGALYEGASRPGHFDGVLTVVAKLLNIVMPHHVVFGRKDAQQVHLVQRMVADLDTPVQVHVVDTVREADGLARSSRNRYLDAAQRQTALVLSRALRAAADARRAPAALAAAHSVIDTEPGLDLDYLAIVDPATFRPVADDHTGPALAIVAARVGSTRLIDNEPLTLDGA